METIKKKINALKEDNEIKQDEIERLQESFSKTRSDRACYFVREYGQSVRGYSERNDRLN